MKHETTSRNRTQAQRTDAEREPTRYMVFDADQRMWVDPAPMTFEEACAVVDERLARRASQPAGDDGSGEDGELLLIPTSSFFQSSGCCPVCGRSCQTIDMQCQRWEFCDHDRIRWCAGEPRGGDMSAELWHTVADRVHGYRIVEAPSER